MAYTIIFVIITVFSIGCLNAVPEITGGPMVANLHESTQVGKQLVCVNCTADTVFEVSLVSVFPSSPCTNCFQVYQTDPLEGYCVNYIAGKGELSYRRAASYNLTVRCTDGVGDSVTSYVDIRIQTNEAPTFELTGQTCISDPIPKTTAAGGVIFDTISGADPDNDSLIYSMTTDPPSTNFEIVPTTGEIKATNILKTNCHPSVTFHISVEDGKNPLVGPKSVTCNFDVYTSPLINNVNKTIDVPENTTVGKNLLTMNVPPTSPPVTYDFYTTPAEAHYLFHFKNRRIKLANLLDYENTALRSIRLTILPSNGFCDPIPHFLHVNVIDSNDLPLISPKVVYKDVYEGIIRLDPGFSISDEDTDDTHYYSIISGDPYGRFIIDPTSGFLSSVAEYDVDLGNMPNTASLVIQVNDTKGHAVDTATLNLNILDANDNPPVFTSTSRRYSVTECTKVGKYLGYLRAKDEVDSSHNFNNEVHFQYASNGKVTVGADGKVYLTGSIPAGTTSILSVNAIDRGIHPYPQTSQVSAIIKVKSSACPTTTNTNTGTGTGTGTGSGTWIGTGSGSGTGTATSTSTTTTTTTTAISLTTGTCEGFFCDTMNVLGVVVGGIGALALLTSIALCIRQKCGNTSKTSPKSNVRDRHTSKAKTERKTTKQKPARI